MTNDTNNKKVSKWKNVKELTEENEADFYRNSDQIHLDKVEDNKSDDLIRE